MVYKVTFAIATPIITTTEIHFDSILSAVHPAMHNINAVTRRSKKDEIITAPLPIDSAKIGRDWVWCCTTGDYGDNATTYTTKMTKRKDGMDYHYLNAKQTPRTGAGRDRCDTIYGVVCDSISFFVSVSSDKNRKELERICRRIKNIGGLRKEGYGAVKTMYVEETEMSWENCLVKDGVAERNLPESFVQEECSKKIAVTPPYWLNDNLVRGVEAGERAVLKNEVFLNENRRLA